MFTNKIPLHFTAFKYGSRVAAILCAELRPLCLPESCDRWFDSQIGPDYYSWFISTIPLFAAFTKVLDVYNLHHPRLLS